MQKTKSNHATHAAGVLPAGEVRSVFERRASWFSSGSGLPKKSLGTMKKRYLDNENNRGLCIGEIQRRIAAQTTITLGSPRTLSIQPQNLQPSRQARPPLPFPFSIPPLSLLCPLFTGCVGDFRRSRLDSFFIEDRGFFFKVMKAAGLLGYFGLCLPFHIINSGSARESAGYNRKEGVDIATAPFFEGSAST